MMVLHITSKSSQTRCVQPVEVFCKPFFDGGEVRFCEAFEVRQKRNTLNDFREMHGLDDALRLPSLRRTNGLPIQKAGGHAGRGIEEPRMQVDKSLLSVT